MKQFLPVQMFNCLVLVSSMLSDDLVLRKLVKEKAGKLRPIAGEVLVFFDHVVAVGNFVTELLNQGYTCEACGTQVQVHNGPK